MENFSEHGIKLLGPIELVDISIKQNTWIQIQCFYIYIFHYSIGINWSHLNLETWIKNDK